MFWLVTELSILVHERVRSGGLYLSASEGNS